MQPTHPLAAEAGARHVGDGEPTEDAGAGAAARAVGAFVQVSRLANPLINEVVIPLGWKDEWNGRHPADDAEFVGHYKQRELAQLLPVLYPGAIPNLASLNASGAERIEIAQTGSGASLPASRTLRGAGRRTCCD